MLRRPRSKKRRIQKKWRKRNGGISMTFTERHEHPVRKFFGDWVNIIREHTKLTPLQEATLGVGIGTNTVKAFSMDKLVSTAPVFFNSIEFNFEDVERRCLGLMVVDEENIVKSPIPSLLQRMLDEAQVKR